MTLDQFVNEYMGDQITDNHGNYWGECVSYVKRYAQESQQVPNADSVLYVKNDLAKNMYLDPTPSTLEYYDKVASNPQKGDIVVYGNPNDNSYGDVAVCLSSKEVIGQLGFPLYYPIAKRSIGSPLGYLRRKGGTTVTPLNRGDIINVYRRFLGHEPTEDDFTYHLNNNGADWNHFIYDLMNERKDLIQDAQAKQIQDLQAQLAQQGTQLKAGKYIVN